MIFLANISLIDLEYVIIFSIIIVQCYLFWKTLLSIYDFRLILKDRNGNPPIKIIQGYISKKDFAKLNDKNIKDYFVDDEQVVNDLNYSKVAIVDTTAEFKNSTLKRIVNSLNSYLIKNIGSEANFEIIKEIIQREMDAKDEEINQSLPTPLYLGLAATMVGIIIGLFGMKTGADLNEVNTNIGTIKDFDVSPIIDGVKIAMSASLVGLLLTTFLSSFFYKAAKRKVLVNINDVLTVLQSELLPIIETSVDVGVKGLKKAISEFNNKFSITVSQLNKISLTTSQNTLEQNKLINKVENLDIHKISKYNMEVFKLMNENMQSFEELTYFFSDLSSISKNLRAFSERTSEIGTITKSIETHTKSTEVVYEFLSSQLKDLEAFRKNNNVAFDKLNSEFLESIDLLEDEIVKRIERLNNKATDLDANLATVFEELLNKIDRATNEHINEFKEVYANSVPKFDKLLHLEDINKSLSQSNKVSTDILAENRFIKSSLNSKNDLGKKLDLIISKLDNYDSGNHRRNGGSKIKRRFDFVNILRVIVYSLVILFILYFAIFLSYF